ncbi:PAN domain protein [Necator americanus]|uniref:PAN domain protein n=1 Tax=Necator americanus TaxID=51031 RepID=W2SM98_NECAM|nr:PAN domain protein [Necator americanus]ETN70668.1 PAN domain protein [Necator americanus]
MLGESCCVHIPCDVVFSTYDVVISFSNGVHDHTRRIVCGSVCENKATGFFVVDNTILGTADSIVYKDTPEEDCLNTCSTNRDRYGRSVLCASFVYDHVSFTCTIFKEKAKPEGKADAVQAVGKRYFEKVCLGDAVPMECADSQFIRADDSVLIGFARNVTLVETMEQCVEQCIKEDDCKSAMYFYEEGECITNTESALSKPNSFAKEENEKATEKKEASNSETPTDETISSNGSSFEEETAESLVSDEGGEPVEGQTSPLDKNKHLSIKRVLESAEKEETEQYPTYFSDWSDWTPCTKGGERQIRRRKCLDLRRCLGALMQVRNCPAVLPEPARNQFDARSPSVVQQPSETVWSPWLGVCQHFASGQPCNNGEMIGFESRECIAKEPSLCDGPFFRYCTLPC